MSHIAPILVIDQGTTSSRAIIFEPSGKALGHASKPVVQSYPQKGWVEQNPEALLNDVILCCQEAIQKAACDISEIQGIGITNQRETTIVWDKRTGKAIYPAIVWQDRRTKPFCATLKQQGMADTLRHKTGLVIDPYFSASKIRWILDEVDEARALAKAGHLLFGTIDSWLIWHLTGNHFTDITNASRTQLFNIHTQHYDDDLLKLFDIPRAMLPEVKACHGDFGQTRAHILGVSLPILACVGDQQSALIGQGCFKKGMSKSTLGTGCFLMTNTEEAIIESSHKLLTTIAYQIQGQTHYALEGSIFNAGTVVEWLQTNMEFFAETKECEALAKESTRDDIFFVPAFTGLGAPYWDTSARGSLVGLDRATMKADIIKAGLDAICYQSQDLLDAIAQDGVEITLMRVDGGMTKNNTLMQRLADLTQTPIHRAACPESTALGAMYLAAIELAIFSTLSDIKDSVHTNTVFTPSLSIEQQKLLYQGWQKAVKATLTQV